MLAITEQQRHEAINASKTVNILKSMTYEEDWHCSSSSSQSRMKKWLKAQSILAGIKQCRNSLQKFSSDDFNICFGLQSSTLHDDLVACLVSLEQTVSTADQELKPKVVKRKGILASLPVPVSLEDAVEVSESQTDVGAGLSKVEDEVVEDQQLPVKLLLESERADSIPVPISDTPARELRSTSIPQSIPSPRINLPDQSMPGFLQTSTALQEDLSSQLAEMARQLKANAVHFSEAMAKDQAVLLETEEKLIQNHDNLSKERTRLRDHSSTSRGTSCLVFLSIIIAIAGFFATFFIIRVT